MTSVQRHLTAAVATAVLMSLPLAGAAQKRPSTPSTSSDVVAERTSPQHHLDEAKRALDSINLRSLGSEAVNRIAVLRRDFNDLATAYAAQSGPSTASHARGAGGSGVTGSTTMTSPGAVGTTGTADRGSAPGASRKNDWRAQYVKVDSDIVGLIGSNSNTAPPNTVDSSKIVPGVANLDANVRGQIQEFRSHLELFFATTLGSAKTGTP